MFYDGGFAGESVQEYSILVYLDANSRSLNNFQNYFWGFLGVIIL